MGTLSENSQPNQDTQIFIDAVKTAQSPADLLPFLSPNVNVFDKTLAAEVVANTKLEMGDAAKDIDPVAIGTKLAKKLEQEAENQRNDGKITQERLDVVKAAVEVGNDKRPVMGKNTAALVERDANGQAVGVER